MKEMNVNSPLDRRGNRWLKRAFDVVFSLAFLCTVFPVLLIIVVIVTECTMPGKLFLIQNRTGGKGSTLGCIKFRTLRTNT